MPSLSEILGLIEGCSSLLALGFLACIDTLLHGSHETPRRKRELEKATHDLWSLDTPAENSLKHNFLLLPNGLQLHYLSRQKDTRDHKAQVLIIFLHGFPDSSYLWSNLLSSDLLSPNATLISLDLPGFGGSDSLPSYAPNDILPTVAIAIAELRKKHAGRCIVVAHDWGGAIASRVAARTHGLVDHLVLVNSLFPLHFRTTLGRRVKRAVGSVSAWWQQPLRTGLLQVAREEGAVFFAQLFKSHYVFMINLPFFSAQRFPLIIHYFITTCHRMASPNSKDEATHWAASLGPSRTECSQSTTTGTQYSSSVSTRASLFPARIWDARLHLYKDGLMSARWTGNLDPTLTAFIPAEEERGGAIDESRIRCPTSVIFGMEDPALDPRICVDGLAEFVQPDSRGKGVLVRLKGVGHWSPVHAVGWRVVERVFAILIKTGEKEFPGNVVKVKDELGAVAPIDDVQVEEL